MTSRILVIDDEALNRTLLTASLENDGYDVSSASNGRLALEILHQRPFDLILLDLVMPELDGFAVLRQIKQSETLQRIPVLVVSASDQMADVVKCIEMGAVDYLPKPFDPVLLHARIRASLATKQMLDIEQEYRKQLEEQNQDLSAFAHTVAHDLKTPITGIVGYLDLLAESYTKEIDQTGVNLLRRIQRMSYNMSGIIDSLLMLAKVRGEHPDPEPIQMASIMRNMFSRLHYQIDKTQVTLHVPETWPIALGHAPWIEEVWVNYVSNAIKYGGSPPVVELGATIQAKSIQFWVQDNGDGISVEQQDSLFTEFTRLTKIGEGTGLGLSIVARILNKLGGTYGVESEVGQGSCFWFALPKADMEAV